MSLSIVLRGLKTKGKPRVYDTRGSWKRREFPPLTEELQELLLKHASVVENVIKRRPKSLDEDEARSEAYLIMCKYIGDWKPGEGVALGVWLYHKMRFGLIDFARRNGFIHHRIKQNGMTYKHIEPVSLNTDCESPLSGNYIPYYALICDLASCQRMADRADWHEAFWEVVAMLEPLSQAIIRGTIEGRTLKEIGADFGLSESRISQIRPGVLDTLIDRLRLRELDGGPHA